VAQAAVDAPCCGVERHAGHVGLETRRTPVNERDVVLGEKWREVVAHDGNLVPLFAVERAKAGQRLTLRAANDRGDRWAEEEEDVGSGELRRHVQRRVELHVLDEETAVRVGCVQHAPHVRVAMAIRQHRHAAGVVAVVLQTGAGRQAVEGHAVQLRVFVESNAVQCDCRRGERAIDQGLVVARHARPSRLDV